MIVIWAIVGAVIGALIDQGWPGAVMGFAVGLLWGRMSGLSRDLAVLRAQVLAQPLVEPRPMVEPRPVVETRPMVERPPHVGAGLPASSSAVSDPSPVPQPPMAPQSPSVAESWGSSAGGAGEPPPLPEGASQPAVARRAGSYSEARVPEEASDSGARVPEEASNSGAQSPPAFERLLGAAKGWFTEGNVPVKVGMLVLFAGVAAFLKYASDTGMFHVSVSARLASVALVAMAGVAFGWLQRDRRRSFALALQGGGVGVLVMTVFAAYRLYALIPAGPTFALLIIFVAGLGVLAVLQDALALAVLGVIAGFAAPILASTGQGSHVALFSYYAVLNLGILGIAWKKAWRVLNVLGFVATFGVGTAWGVLRYSPGLFASTEPFLILHFLLYLIVPWLHVLRSPKRDRAILDGCLMFGNPIASLLLQGALLDWQPIPLAISALVAAVIYVAIAFAIRTRGDMSMLRDTWAVLAVTFATIAVPLASSASVTSSVFALEGAGLIWLGFRQGRRLPRWAGVFLQLAAGVAWVLASLFHAHRGDVPLLSAAFIGSLLIVIGAGLGVWQFDRHGTSRGASGLARIGLLLWAVVWWLVGLGNEIDAFVSEPSTEAACWMALTGVTAWLLAEGCSRARKLDLGVVLAFAVPVFLGVGLVVAASAGNARIQLLSGWPLASVVVMAVTGWLALRGLLAHRVAAIVASCVWWVRWLAIVTLAITVAWDHVPAIGDGWFVLAVSLPALLLAALVVWWPRIIVSPLQGFADAVRPAMGVCVSIAMLCVAINALCATGSATPLPFVPVLNPVDLLLIAVLLFIARVFNDEAMPPTIRHARPAVVAVSLFIVATSMTLRAVHHLGDVPWNADMPHSSLAELSLTVVWSVIGVMAWVLGSKRGQRMLWFAGAGTMGIVLLKLLLVDRVHLGNLFGIASFIAYGLLCTVIGYLAPAPPRQSSPESSHVS